MQAETSIFVVSVALLGAMLANLTGCSSDDSPAGGVAASGGAGTGASGGTGGGGFSGQCCTPHLGPGCENPNVAACVCAQDPFCCDSDWTSECVMAADSFGCASCIPGQSTCQPGSTEACYDGPPGTEGLGPCTGGVRTCSTTGSFGPCVGEVEPSAMDCSTPDIDEACNGTADPCINPPPFASLYGAEGLQIATAIASDSAGNMIVSGTNEGGVIDFGGGPLAQQGIFLAKLGPSGGLIWQKVFSGVGGPRTVATDASGSVFVCGWFDATIDFGGGPLTAGSGGALFLVKLDSAGQHVFSKAVPIAGAEGAPRGAAVTAGGDIVVTGMLVGTADFGGGPLVSAGGAETCSWDTPEGNAVSWPVPTLVNGIGAPILDASGATTPHAFQASTSLDFSPRWSWRADLVAGKVAGQGACTNEPYSCSSQSAVFTTTVGPAVSSRDTSADLRDTFGLVHVPRYAPLPDFNFPVLPICVDAGCLPWFDASLYLKDPLFFDFGTAFSTPVVLARSGSTVLAVDGGHAYDISADVNPGLAAAFGDPNLMWLTLGSPVMGDRDPVIAVKKHKGGVVYETLSPDRFNGKKPCSML